MRYSKQRLELAVLVVLVAVLAVVWWQRQAISDWLRLRGYSPPTAITELASKDTMTAKARHLFYLNRPQMLGDKISFRQACPISEQTIVLGCYKGNENGIAIYNVNDPRLSGVEEVTAAHEMLHAAYDRLSDQEKQSVDHQLQSFYQNGLKDKRVKATIDSYRRTEPKDVVNEMHSILGTEVADLPSGLDSYYQRYFTDRNQVVSMAEKYEAVFASNEKQLDDLKRRIDGLSASLKAQKLKINSERASLATESRRMQALLNSGRTTEYNAAVQGYNDRVADLRSSIDSYNSQVNTINGLVKQYNRLAIKQKSLVNSIDTRLQPAAQ